MRTMITIVSALIIAYSAVPQKVFAQAKATATITATVIPSVSIELGKINSGSEKEIKSSQTINLRGIDNILVVVDSKEVKSAKILQLTTKEPKTVILPSSFQAGKTSITYLSS
jgi:hypothetical protein